MRTTTLLAVTALSLLSACSTSINCQTPPIPSKDASAEEWQAHRQALLLYKDCLGAKASASADEALNTADSATDSVKRWIGSARSKLHN